MTAEILRLLQASSCFRGEVCASLPCACAETLAALSRPAQCAPMLADIAQIIDAGWKAGKSSAEVAEQVLREFDGPAVTLQECGEKS